MDGVSEVRFFKNNNNVVFAYEDNQTPDPKLTEITENEKAAILEQKRTVEEAKAAAIVPESVPMASARIILNRAGLLAGVDGAIDAMPEPQKTEAGIEWEYQTSVRRDSVLVAGIIQAMGLTDSQVDDMFRAARDL